MDHTPAILFDPRTVTRPAPVLMQYYTVISLLTVFAFPIVLLVNFFKYETLKYRFDDDGVSMSWGILFRREINLTYRRIQDIHVTRNIIQRWMGLATVSVQTASGTGAEMQIEGILEYDALRDYLYSKMRGAKGIEDSPGAHEAATAVEDDEALVLLRRIAENLEAVRERLGAGGPR